MAAGPVGGMAGFAVPFGRTEDEFTATLDGVEEEVDVCGGFTDVCCGGTDVVGVVAEGCCWLAGVELPDDVALPAACTLVKILHIRLPARSSTLVPV
jgi:hypothetical protein